VATWSEPHDPLRLGDPSDRDDLALQLRGLLVESKLGGSVAFPLEVADRLNERFAVVFEDRRDPCGERVRVAVAHAAAPRELPLQGSELNRGPAEVQREDACERARGRERGRPTQKRTEVTPR